MEKVRKRVNLRERERAKAKAKPGVLKRVKARARANQSQKQGQIPDILKTLAVEKTAVGIVDVLTLIQPRPLEEDALLLFGSLWFGTCLPRRKIVETLMMYKDHLYLRRASVR